jgi:uncharacterized protein
MNQRHASATILLAAILLIGALVSPRRSGLALNVAAQEGQGITPIYDIQGAGKSSPVVDTRVDTYGRVTGVTRDGFYLQNPVGDGDPDTSDGLFVYTYSRPTVRSGECVTVRNALVQEFYGKTELSWIGRVEPSAACQPGAPAPVALPLPRLGMDPEEQYERWEGMLVEVRGIDGFVHGPTKRYNSGEAEIAYLPTALQPAVQYGRILREGDGADKVRESNRQAEDALHYLSSLLGGDLPSAKWGDRIRSGEDGRAPLRAVLDYNFGKYQLLLLPGETVDVEPNPLVREAGLATSAADFSVCTFNVHGLGRGEAQFSDAADYVRAIDRSARVIAESLHGCTIVGLQETGTPADAAALAAWLQDEYGLPYHAVAAAGPASEDVEFPLTNSFLVRTDRVEVVNWFGMQGCSERDYEVTVMPGERCPPGQFPLFNRPPLVLDVMVAGDWGERFALRVINNHWKSKAGDERANAERRLLQAQHVASIVQDSLSGRSEPALIVLGDLNDFNSSVPVSLLTDDAAHPLVNVWQYLPVADRYSFIFNGVSQVLDHVLISPNMVQLLSGVDANHVNADYANCGLSYLRDRCQVSDHDPLAIRLQPNGATAVGGDFGLPGIGVQLESIESGVRAEAISGRDGGFRLWGIAPGEVRIEYTAPEWVTVDHPDTTTVLAEGFTMLGDPGVRLDSAVQAAASASALIDAIVAQE